MVGSNGYSDRDRTRIQTWSYDNIVDHHGQEIARRAGEVKDSWPKDEMDDFLGSGQERVEC